MRTKMFIGLTLACAFGMLLLDKQGRWRFLYVSRTPIEVVVQDIRRVLAE